MSLTEIIRTAFVDNTCRNFMFLQIQKHTGCSRHCAKALTFAFIYHATEEYLQKIFEENK
ncbi:hypothetical protein [Klebsiella phage 175018]|jgi:hypothetical protein|uniref:Uncharacterized protein n=8 Tax=Przondovirus TaxID=1985720 RepID=A0A7S6R7G4_9CAUD|nr:hypothetical protein [Klebsiella phage 117]QOV06384.1 hypothetical protein DNHFEEIH_00010 [Klebsiella phage 066013]QOV06461.1 hypothetical protein LCNEBBCH_00150 [Klebsiella phage 066015]UUU45415.1 hypothetical protein [Klebsiella phage NK20]WNA09171.1 hypothetical protein [Klebsiella phage P67_1]WNK74578.1 hypothetical protein [Klebsiella phage PCCM_KpP1172]WNO29425.1 hypothetical protein [Klebsiella phage P55]